MSKPLIGNIPEVKIGVVGVSRDCFLKSLTEKRLTALMDACENTGVEATVSSIVIENENDAVNACKELKSKGINAAVIYLGNFGPEGPLSLFAQEFGGPTMLCAAAEESGDNLMDGRGDAYCGMLNACYNFGLRNLSQYVPEMPVGLPDELARQIARFADIARILIGIKQLKIFGFGPRPHDFLACNAPIKPLFDLGVQVMENSELDLFESYSKHAGDERIGETVKSMSDEVGKSNPSFLVRLAQFELTLLDFYKDNLGASNFGVFANKCWPAFQTTFGFCPCYVNGRLANQGIPVACEVDIYGALSEYICTLATQSTATLLDINNSVPADMIVDEDLYGASAADLFMGFHCGNTAASCMKNCNLGHQLIMHRLLESGQEPDITRGTLEGQLMPGPVSIFRLQSSADGKLKSYMANGNVLDIDPRSFGGIGIIAIPEFARFYRHALLQKQYPHHTAVAFKQVGDVLFDAMKLLGVPDISAPKPAGSLYETENPFS